MAVSRARPGGFKIGRRRPTPGTNKEAQCSHGQGPASTGPAVRPREKRRKQGQDVLGGRAGRRNMLALILMNGAGRWQVGLKMTVCLLEIKTSFR